MRWLLIGGDGFIGSHLSEYLLANKQEVIIYDNNSFSRPAQISLPKRHWYCGDVGNQSTLASVVGAHIPDIVCWLPAFHAYNVGENPFLRVAWLNYTLNTVLPVVASAGSRFCLFSSDNVYVPKEFPINENDPIKWGATKTETQGYVITEWYTQTLCKHLKIPYQILRLANVVGNRMFSHPVVDRLSFIIDNILIENESLVVVSPEQKKDYIPVADAVKMIFKVVKQGENDTVYNIGSSVGVKNIELLQMLDDIIHPSVLPKVVEREEGNTVLDVSKAQRIAKIKITPLGKVIHSIVNYRKSILKGE